MYPVLLISTKSMHGQSSLLTAPESLIIFRHSLRHTPASARHGSTLVKVSGTDMHERMA
jgi:hypothetical protein